MTFTALISDNDDIIDCNKWHFNRFLNPCLFDCNKWHFNRFPNACLNTYVNPGSVAQFDFHQSDNSNVSFPLISFLSSSDLMDSERVWYYRLHDFGFHHLNLTTNLEQASCHARASALVTPTGWNHLGRGRTRRSQCQSHNSHGCVPLARLTIKLFFWVLIDLIVELLGLIPFFLLEPQLRASGSHGRVGWELLRLYWDFYPVISLVRRVNHGQNWKGWERSG